ncbi:MAG: 2-oxoacid:acceptor oxidoreductase family protein [Desulfuromonadaceae bacterium]
MYRIRFHGRGGQGMKTASRILGTALFRAGFEVQDAPRYGAERRGAPIFAYVRADRKPIHERGIIANPDLVIVADDTLVAVPAAGVLQGIDTHTLLLIHSRQDLEQWRHRLKLPGALLVLPAEAEQVEARYLGTVCAAAAASLLGDISWETLEAALQEELAQLDATVVTANQDHARKAYHQMHPYRGVFIPGLTPTAYNYQPPQWIDPVYEGERSVPAIHAARSSERVPTGLWRTRRPVIDPARCRHCGWLCSTFCPDGVIQVDAEGKPQIDYQHCKGCLMCLTQCPHHAITTVPEEQAEETGGKS